LPSSAQAQAQLEAELALFSFDPDKPMGRADKPMGRADKPMGRADKPMGPIDKPMGRQPVKVFLKLRTSQNRVKHVSTVKEKKQMLSTETGLIQPSNS
jgi:hypothetical protein